MTLVTACCGVDTYVDGVDGGTYCTVCDREIDVKTGRQLTERERIEALCLRDMTMGEAADRMDPATGVEFVKQGFAVTGDDSWRELTLVEFQAQVTSQTDALLDLHNDLPK